jgi:hypothetical protein
MAQSDNGDLPDEDPSTNSMLVDILMWKFTKTTAGVRRCGRNMCQIRPSNS